MHTIVWTRANNSVNNNIIGDLEVECFHILYLQSQLSVYFHGHVLGI